MEGAKGNYRETCLVIMSGLLVFWLIYQIKVLVTIALLIGLIGAFVPGLANWIHWTWFKLAEGMGWVMSKVILTLVFFIVLWPMAVLSKIFGKKDPLRLRKSDKTTWTSRDHAYTKADLEKPW